MQKPPEQKGQRGPMPETGKSHGGHQIETLSLFAATVPPQRDIKIISHPGGQGDMPALPEIRKA